MVLVAKNCKDITKRILVDMNNGLSYYMQRIISFIPKTSVNGSALMKFVYPKENSILSLPINREITETKRH
jgi:hypothetical protein